MSFAAQRWAYQQQCGNGIEKAVLAFLAFSASRHSGDCFPSIKTIVRNVQHTERAVRAALKALAARKLIECERRFMPSGRCTSTLYRLPVVPLPTAAPTQETPMPTPGPAQETPTTPAPAPVQEEPLSKEDSNPRGGREWAPASPPPPAPSPSSGSILPPQKEESGQRVEPTAPPKRPASWIVAARSARKIPLPADWEPSQELRQMAIANGLDPDDIRYELHDWWLRNRIPQGDWDATYRGFVRQAKRVRPAAKERPASNAAALFDRIQARAAAVGGQL
jgi:hypothetical protein